MNMLIPTPEEARRAAREATYPNRQTEEAAVYETDQRANDKYRMHESFLVVQADAASHEASVSIDKGERINSDVQLFASAIRRGDIVPDEYAARDAEAHRARLVDSVATLKAYRGRLEHSIANCEDPAASLERLLQRFPVLRR